MIFLIAFLTSIIFTTTLIGVGSLVMGSVYRDRSLLFFGLKALLIAVLALIVTYVLLLPYIKELEDGLKTFAEVLISILK